MNHGKLAEAPVRMVVSGSIVERCDTDRVLSIIASRLHSPSPGLAVGSVNLDHLHHFRKLSEAPAGRLEWLLLADGMPIAWRGQLLTAQPWSRNASIVAGGIVFTVSAPISGSTYIMSL